MIDSFIEQSSSLLLFALGFEASTDRNGMKFLIHRYKEMTIGLVTALTAPVQSRPGRTHERVQ
jgi:hypothetical protein